MAQMEIGLLQFANETFWKLSPTNPPSFKIKAHPGVELISPLLYPSLDCRLNSRATNSSRGIFGCVGGLCLVRSREVAFRIDESHLSIYLPQSGGLPSGRLAEAIPLVGVATSLLYALRHFSKQAGMSAGGDAIIAFVSSKIGDLPAFAPLTEFTGKSMVNKSIFDNAITRGHIELACACDVGFRAPVYDTLFLDAISAHAASDYRKSILYSAMAMETAAATLLDEHYESKVRQSDDAAWRTITLPQSGGEVVRKDPIWEFIRRGDNFGLLLHEAPLYLLRRSLLVENEPLFQKAKRLRATRNKIVHEGEPPETGTDQYLTIDHDGSSDALNCAKEVLGWIGIAEEYKLPGFRGMVELSSTPVSGGSP